MFYAISWQGYWTTLAILALLYYVAIIALYYKEEVANILKGRQGLNLFPTASQMETVREPPLFRENKNNEFDTDAPEANPIVTSLVDELQAFFEEAKDKDYTKDILIQALKKMIQKYPAVKNTGYRSSVNSLIIFLAEQSCSLHLSAEVVGGLWFDKG